MSTKILSGRKTGQLNDVFVIGAGASVPYGFPTGARLLQLLREERFDLPYKVQIEILDSVLQKNLKSRMAVREFASENWAVSDERALYLEWSRKLRGSVILTIDQFLRNMGDSACRELGKRLMARQILTAEWNSCHPPSEGKVTMHSLDWIQEFLTRVDLLENWHDYLLKTTFLTFNYDRVLEFFLLRYLMVDKAQSDESAKNFVRSMNILHINGHLGSMEEIPFGNRLPQDEMANQFDPLFDHAAEGGLVDWTAVSSRMRTVWEDPEHWSVPLLTERTIR